MGAPILLGFANRKNCATKYSPEKGMKRKFAMTRKDGKILPEESTNDNFESPAPGVNHPVFEREFQNGF